MHACMHDHKSGKMTTTSIKADIVYNGMVVAKNATIPLEKRERYPGKYDLIYSLRRLPILKKYQIRKIGKYESEPGFGKKNVTFFFDRDASDNLLDEEQVKRLNRLYAAQGRERRVITLVIDPNTGQDEEITRFECAVCQADATLADVRLNLPFCSEVCWENYQ